jgi:hypothetical protein
MESDIFYSAKKNNNDGANHLVIFKAVSLLFWLKWKKKNISVQLENLLIDWAGHNYLLKITDLSKVYSSIIAFMTWNIRVIPYVFARI